MKCIETSENKDIIMEEWKLLQSIINRLEINEYRVRGWMFTLLTAFSVGVISGKLTLEGAEIFCFGFCIVLVFFISELLDRITKRAAIDRMSEVEKCLRGESEYIGPSINLELEKGTVTAKNLKGVISKMKDEFNLLRVCIFYVLVLTMLILISLWYSNV